VGRALMSQWQEGWWNATPVEEGATSRTLRVMAFLGAIVMLLVVATASAVALRLLQRREVDL